MTFKPFPMPGREEEPSPLHYGTKPGDQAVKMTKPKGPNPLICGTHDLNYGKGNTPGPNKYNNKHSSQSPKSLLFTEYLL